MRKLPTSQSTENAHQWNTQPQIRHLTNTYIPLNKNNQSSQDFCGTVSRKSLRARRPEGLD